MHSSFLIKDTNMYWGVVLHSEMCPVACKALYIFKVTLTCFSCNSLNVTSSRFWSAYYFFEYQHHSTLYWDTKPEYVKADRGDEVGFVFGGPYLAGDISLWGKKLNISLRL